MQNYSKCSMHHVALINTKTMQGEDMEEQQETSAEVQRPQKGEIWYVQLPSAATINEMHVLDVTAKTCLLRDRVHAYMENRYRLDEIKWIEQVHAVG